MSWLINTFKVDREQMKENLVSHITDKILFNQENLTHVEQTEILNRVTYRVLMAKKEERSKLLQEAREVQKSLVDIKI